jgi:disulfide bond formation protein DsbB
MPFLTRHVRLIYLSYALFSLAIAYVYEYYFKVLPCDLCIYYRYLIFSFVFLIALSYCVKIQKILQAWVLLLFCFSSYQVAVEHKWIKELGICSKDMIFDSKNFYNKTKKDQKKIILDNMRKSSIPCDEVRFKFFGISGNIFNAILLFLLFLLPFDLQKKKKF